MTIDKTKECGLQRLDGPSIRAKRYRPSSADTGYDNVANALFTHRRQTRVRGGNVPYPRNVITTLYAFREQACNSHPHVTTLSKIPECYAYSLRTVTMVLANGTQTVGHK